MQVDYGAVNEWLYAKGSRGDCAMCGMNQWQGLGEMPGSETMLLNTFTAQGDPSPTQGFRVIGWACGNCAFVRLHSVDVMKALGGPAPADEE